MVTAEDENADLADKREVRPWSVEVVDPFGRIVVKNAAPTRRSLSTVHVVSNPLGDATPVSVFSSITPETRGSGAIAPWNAYPRRWPLDDGGKRIVKVASFLRTAAR